MEGMVDTVDLVAIFELLSRFALINHAERGFQVNLLLKHRVKFPAPDSYSHLIVRIVYTGIEDVNVSRLPLCSSVADPEITMNQAGFDHSPIRFQRSKNLGNDVRDQAVYTLLQILPIAIELSIQPHGPSAQLNVVVPPSLNSTLFLERGCLDKC